MTTRMTRNGCKSSTYSPHDQNDKTQAGEVQKQVQHEDPEPTPQKKPQKNGKDHEGANEHDEDKPNVIVETFHKVTDSVKNFWASIFT